MGFCNDRVSMQSDFAGISTTDTHGWADRLNAAIAQAIAKGDAVDDTALLWAVLALAEQNAAQAMGGPFAALVVDSSAEVPVVVGLAAAHHHGDCLGVEIEALRNAAQRLGYSDVSQMVLYTVRECGAMALAAAHGCGIARIVYAAPRTEPVSGAALYQLADDRLMTHIADDARDALLEKLESHGAVVLDQAGRVLAFGDAGTHSDLLAVPSMQAIRGALERGGGDCFAEGCTLVSYRQPHIISVLMADRVRLLRPRSTSNPQARQQDSHDPDPMRICYLNDAPEQLVLRDAQGQDIIARDAKDTRDQLSLPPQQREMQAEMITCSQVQARATQLLAQWQQDESRVQYASY